MKLRHLLAAWILASAPLLMGQGVFVELAFDQDHFIPHEKLVVKVRITNFSGQTLKLGKEEGWLKLNVEGRNNFVVSRKSPVPVQGEFTLESSTTAIKRIDLAPHFELSRPGNYQVTATVAVPEWGQVFQSPAKSFNIIAGSKIWEQDFGVPPSPGENPSVPEFRRYALIQAVHLKQLTLYLRLSDATETVVHRVFPLGRMVSFSRPEPQLDKYSNLHLLYQIGARDFAYLVVNPDGLLIARETYSQRDARPYLKTDPDGRMMVAGGIRRVSSDDLPPPVISSAKNDTPLPDLNPTP